MSATRLASLIVIVTPSQQAAAAYAYAMHEENPQRSDQCRACGQPAAGDGGRCIFCGSSLLLERIYTWRSVYHPYSYADGLLANATLQAHGVNTRLRHERMLIGQAAGVVEVAEGEHLFAQEVLRQLRGVRTDTEYREWQEFKQRRAKHRLMWCIVATATAAAAITALWLHARGTVEPAAEAAGERGHARDK
jgi:hypothetical protein